MRNKLQIALAGLLLAFPVIIHADELTDLTALLAKAIPGAQPDSITPGPIVGLYELVYGTDVYYVSNNGQFMIQGDVLDLGKGENLTEARRALERLKVMNTVPETSMIVFAPQVVKHTLTVFTDIDCGYCRKMHKEMTQLNKHGIKVRYLAYPRSGIDTPSYDKAVSVWCAKDRNAALTQAKSDGDLDAQVCDNPVKQHMEIANKFGVTGTPTLMTEDGRFIQGYLPVDDLIKALDEGKAKT